VQFCVLQIALQFPDRLLADAVTVANELRQLTEQRVFILGDTTYGRCEGDK
jgi:diphthamide biosynthesis enzyme Dph1/Dph2-like protein